MDPPNPNKSDWSLLSISLAVRTMDSALFPHKIVQTPALVMILYEEQTMFRQIFTDARSLPADPEPAFLGHSVGRWDGDVLVVEANGFPGQRLVGCVRAPAQQRPASHRALPPS